jgi:hypothetical protein
VSLEQTSELTSTDREALAKAVKSLEYPSLAARLTNLVGKPVELIGYAMPSFASKAIASATSKGLEAALKVALRTLPRSPRTGSALLHRALATASGAAGGTFGLVALPLELPVSTVIMLRSIADIAQSEGEDLSHPASVLSCVEVFALGGRAGSVDASESGYFAVRGMLAKTVTEAARFVAERGVIQEGAPILLKFVTQVAARFWDGKWQMSTIGPTYPAHIIVSQAEVRLVADETSSATAATIKTDQNKIEAAQEIEAAEAKADSVNFVT